MAGWQDKSFSLANLLSTVAGWITLANGKSIPAHGAILTDPTTGLALDTAAPSVVRGVDDVVFGPTNLTAVGHLIEVDTTGYNSIIVEVSQNNGSQLQFETTEDGSFISPYPMKSNDSLAIAASVVTGTSVRYAAKTQKYFRARLLTYANSTPVIVRVRLSTRMPLDAVRGDVVAYLNPRTDNGVSISRILAASGVIKSSRGQLYGYDLINTAAAIRYLQIFAKTTAPTLGTDTPAYTIPLPAGQARALFSALGYALTTGLSYAVTTDAAGATAGSAGDVVGTIGYL